MKRISFIHFLLLSCLTAFSQDTYTTVNGEIIHGVIENNREWLKNPLSVDFKEDKSGNTVIITPQNCRGLTAGNDVYISYHGTKIINTDDATKKRGLLSDSLVKDTIQVFLRQVYNYSGYALYKLYDGERTNFYFSENGVISELEYFESIKQAEENGVANESIIPYEGYKSFLFEKFKGNTDNIATRIQTLRYTENDLINFLAKELNDKAHASEKQRDKYPAEIFAGIGAGFNSVTLVSITGSNLNSHQTTVAPDVEIGLRAYSQRNFGKFYFQTWLRYVPVSNAFKYYSNTYKLSASLLNVNLGAGYMFIKSSSFSLFADANADFCFLAGLRTKHLSPTSTIDDKSTDMNLRLTPLPEVGLTIHQCWSAVLSGIFPIRLAYRASTNYNYKMSVLSLSVRYKIK